MAILRKLVLCRTKYKQLSAEIMHTGGIINNIIGINVY